MKYELTNGRTVRTNGNKRMVETQEKLMQVAVKAGYRNIHTEIGSTGNTIWVGDLGDFAIGGMFAIERIER